MRQVLTSPDRLEIPPFIVGDAIKYFQSILTRLTLAVDYFFSFAGFRNLVLVAGCTASYALFVTLPQYWLKLWTESDSDSTAYYIAGLLAIAFVAWASTSGTLWYVLI